MRASSCSTCTVPLAAELAGKLPATCSPVGAGAGGGASNADMADVNISIESATRGELGSGAGGGAASGGSSAEPEVANASGAGAGGGAASNCAYSISRKLNLAPYTLLFL
jgi:hypothetical protein